MERFRRLLPFISSQNIGQSPRRGEHIGQQTLIGFGRSHSGNQLAQFGNVCQADKIKRNFLVYVLETLFFAGFKRLRYLS